MKTKQKMQYMLTVLQELRADRRARVDMDEYGSLFNLGMPDWPDSMLDAEWDNPSCGTAACYAGWSFIHPDIRRDMKREGYSVPEDVADWLAAGTDIPAHGLNNDSVFDRLFYPDLQQPTRAKTLDLLERNLRRLHRDMGFTDELKPAY